MEQRVELSAASIGQAIILLVNGRRLDHADRLQHAEVLGGQTLSGGVLDLPPGDAEPSGREIIGETCSVGCEPVGVELEVNAFHVATIERRSGVADARSATSDARFSAAAYRAGREPRSLAFPSGQSFWSKHSSQRGRWLRRGTP